ncbi:alpha/beta hydrolase family protein [Saccharibacillus qingshengii]|uniref:alpha/beta hydrolase family protein n=1 Tax=Saccharibacillus qingshengii TaxID=1763540 RepID=UPI001556BB6D|nr:dienelactone hydrolase [Saccharibacillus qingshengii]
MRGIALVGAAVVLILLVTALVCKKERYRLLRRCAYAGMGLALAGTVGLLYAFPVFKLPEPQGDYPVGTQALYLVDTDRQEKFDGPVQGPRALMVQVWYPAQAGTGRPAAWIPDPRILPYMAAQYGLPEFTFDYLEKVSAHAYPQAAVSSARPTYPLILANPGNASSRFFHTSQAEYLAARGYIVAVIDHTYNTFATEFPDGKITTTAADSLFSPDDDYRTGSVQRDRLGRLLTDDVTFVLDQFEQMQSGQIPSDLQGKLDLGHIGTFGHSIGGAAAYDASFDPRIAAGIDLDGGLYRLRERGELRKPFLFITSDSYFGKLRRVLEQRPYTDEEIESMGSTRAWEEAAAQDKRLELKRMQEAVEAGGQALYIENTEHLNFTDAQFLSPLFARLGLTGEIAPERAGAVVNAYMLDFFDQHLKNKDGILTKKTDSRFPEVKFIRFP